MVDRSDGANDAVAQGPELPIDTFDQLCSCVLATARPPKSPSNVDPPFVDYTSDRNCTLCGGTGILQYRGSAAEAGPEERFTRCPVEHRPPTKLELGKHWTPEVMLPTCQFCEGEGFFGYQHMPPPSKYMETTHPQIGVYYLVVCIDDRNLLDRGRTTKTFHEAQLVATRWVRSSNQRWLTYQWETIPAAPGWSRLSRDGRAYSIFRCHDESLERAEARGLPGLESIVDGLVVPAVVALEDAIEAASEVNGTSWPWSWRAERNPSIG